MLLKALLALLLCYKGSSTPSNAPSVGVVGVENVENVVDGANSPVTATSAEGCRWAGATNDTHASSGSDTRRLQENVQNVQNVPNAAVEVCENVANVGPDKDGKGIDPKVVAGENVDPNVTDVANVDDEKGARMNGFSEDEEGGATTSADENEPPVDGKGRGVDEGGGNPIGPVVVSTIGVLLLFVAAIIVRRPLPRPGERPGGVSRAPPSLGKPRKPPDGASHRCATKRCPGCGWGARTPRLFVSFFFFFCVLMVGSVAAVKITEHSCYTGWNPETSTRMNCNSRGLTGAYSYYYYYPTSVFTLL